eukprot:CAMPEP_0113309216 /NCGR_PEP_ID=MMETSP0010_2-20120614/7353_1 /TAXON_ID=216773 ORGANISM="Corethron hystrix, Strain 308" /NCGR_SAMPLE_ID=MMETSP0010_2 /ASSEMBLY_ACC=CAM_ASM_000155 /LENGTH=350 /DNA_ID=CAMNT_0000164433 /DNA_START=42 /DNA_END=1094 /DNA_ORIENTATION=+ /assembly_acc=CAM_ASM_000155
MAMIIATSFLLFFSRHLWSGTAFHPPQATPLLQKRSKFSTPAAYRGATTRRAKIRRSDEDVDARLFDRRGAILASSSILLPVFARSAPAAAAPTDEFTVEFSTASPLGLEIADRNIASSRRVYVKSVREGSQAEGRAKAGLIVVAVDGEEAERTDAAGVRQMLRAASGKETVVLTFRDPDIFLDALRGGLKEGETATTKIAPAGDIAISKSGPNPTQASQEVSVTRLATPGLCTVGASFDDLLEIEYTGTVVETGIVFDGSSIKVNGGGIPGRGGDTSIYFVLGKQPFGQFPPSWDVGIEGMCVGERRRLIIPPVLAYGKVGVPRRGIPPDATLQYDVTLLSINGLALPR